MAPFYRKPLPAVAFANAIALLVSSNASAADYVIAISVDGLRPIEIREMGAEELPNFYRIRTEGIWTDNARTDYYLNYTDPNHLTMVTARPSEGPNGHHINRVLYPDATSETYVSSLFDVAHDHGFSTAFYSAKSKLLAIERSYTHETGGEDLIGEDNGRDKIDHFEVTETSMTDVLTNLFVQQMRETPFNLTFFHMVDPDEAGHFHRWGSEEYRDAVRRVDGYLGQLFELIEEEPFAGKTTLMLTSDHGGRSNGSHGDSSHPENYTIPFYVWGVDVPVSGDLYAANVGSRVDPEGGLPTYEQEGQPIRNGDLANLSLSFLGLPAVPDEEAIINKNQDLSVMAKDELPRWSEVGIQQEGEGMMLTWESAGPEVHYQVETSVSMDPASWERVSGEEPIMELSYPLPAESGAQFFRVRLISVEE